MRVKRDDCRACDTAQYIVRLTHDEAVLLAREIRNATISWPGPLSQRLTERIEKVTR